VALEVPARLVVFLIMACQAVLRAGGTGSATTQSREHIASSASPRVEHAEVVLSQINL
jgi:hypothetical protein